MELPQELVDEIIDHLPPDDKKSLRNCSLVAKSWTRPSQKCLFEDISIDQHNLQSWLENIPPTNILLLEYVRKLSYSEFTTGEIPTTHCALRDHLPSLRQLRYLNLTCARISSCLEYVGPFSAFQHTLSTISLVHCKTTKGGLITLINYFPNLSCLGISALGYIQENDPTLPLTRTLFAKLCVTTCPAGTLVLFEELSGLGLRFEEVVISNTTYEPEWSHFSKRIIDIFGGSVKRLNIIRPHNGNRHHLTLSHCQELREFEAFTLRLNHGELDLLSSITSVKIEKIILAYAYVNNLQADHASWTQLDEILTKLAERPKDKPWLEVAFRSIDGGRKWGSDLRKYLPRFVQKGRMTVLSPEYEVFYSSDEGRGGGDH